MKSPIQRRAAIAALLLAPALTACGFNEQTDQVYQPAVGVNDRSDNVYVLNRGPHPVIVFDKAGNFVTSWGEGEFNSRAHGIFCSPDDHIWTVNDNQHCVKKYTTEGKLVLTIGKEGEPAQKWGGQPFNTPTNAAVSPNTGDIYITDGYGNSRVHRYTSEGKHIVSWGAPGIAPGEFQIPHNVVIDENENVYVTDRDNYRLQVFDNMPPTRAWLTIGTMVASVWPPST